MAGSGDQAAARFANEDAVRFFTQALDFTRTDDLQTKIEAIPFKIDLKSETRDLDFTGNRPAEAFLTIQMIDIQTGANVARSGPLYLRSNYDGITYPQNPVLDARGFARVPLIFSPPDSSDADLDGNIYVWALLDQEDADDTQEGRALFRFNIGSSTERFEIEAETGEGRRRN